MLVRSRVLKSKLMMPMFRLPFVYFLLLIFGRKGHFYYDNSSFDNELDFLC